MGVSSSLEVLQALLPATAQTTSCPSDLVSVAWELLVLLALIAGKSMNSSFLAKRRKEKTTTSDMCATHSQTKVMAQLLWPRGSPVSPPVGHSAYLKHMPLYIQERPQLHQSS